MKINSKLLTLSVTASAEIFNKSDCENAGMCPRNYDPVCGNQGPLEEKKDTTPQMAKIMAIFGEKWRYLA